MKRISVLDAVAALCGRYAVGAVTYLLRLALIDLRAFAFALTQMRLLSLGPFLSGPYLPF